MREIKTISQLFPSGAPTAKRKILAIFAHPDDESLNAGGLLAKATKEGIKTYLLCLSFGERGIVDPEIRGDELKDIRKKELFKAARILGIKEVFFGGFPDGGLLNNKEEVKRCIEKIIVWAKPLVIITHDPSGGTGHPDHITTSWAAKLAVKNKDKLANLFYAVAERQAWIFGRRFLAERRRRFAPTYWIKLGQFSQSKSLACLAHKSQKLKSAFPLEMKIWWQIFDREYLYLVDLAKKEKFLFKGFQTKYFRFSPGKKPSLVA